MRRYSSSVSMFLGCLLALAPCNAVSQSPFSHARRMEVDVYGNILILDGQRQTLRLYVKDLALLREAGGPGWQEGEFDQAAGVWARNGIDVFVSDYGNHRIQRFDRQLAFISSYSTRDRENPAERFGYPLDVAVSRMGDLFICDGENVRILQIGPSGRVERAFGDYGAGVGRLRSPTRVEIGPQDNIYVLDGERVMVYDAFGNFLSELYSDVLRHPVCLFADQEGILVTDEGTLYSFDAHQRPGPSLLLSAFTQRPDLEVVSVGVRNGVLYMLTVEGIFKGPDPRTAREGQLDKE